MEPGTPGHTPEEVLALEAQRKEFEEKTQYDLESGGRYPSMRRRITPERRDAEITMLALMEDDRREFYDDNREAVNGIIDRFRSHEIDHIPAIKELMQLVPEKASDHFGVQNHYSSCADLFHFVATELYPQEKPGRDETNVVTSTE